MTTFPRSLFNLENQKRSGNRWSCGGIKENVLLIVPDGKLQVTRHNTLLLVITSGVTSQLQDLGSEILENSSEVH
jgi:hypothetical protein